MSRFYTRKHKATPITPRKVRYKTGSDIGYRDEPDLKNLEPGPRLDLKEADYKAYQEALTRAYGESRYLYRGMTPSMLMHVLEDIKTHHRLRSGRWYANLDAYNYQVGPQGEDIVSTSISPGAAKDFGRLVLVIEKQAVSPYANLRNYAVNPHFLSEKEVELIEPKLNIRDVAAIIVFVPPEAWNGGYGNYMIDQAKEAKKKYGIPFQIVYEAPPQEEPES